MKLSTFAAFFTLLLSAHTILGQQSKELGFCQPHTRAEILAAANAPAPIPLPIPVAAIQLPEDAEQSNISIRLSRSPQGRLSVRRVSHNDGRLYLEIRSSEGALSGTVEIRSKGKSLPGPRTQITRIPSSESCWPKLLNLNRTTASNLELGCWELQLFPRMSPNVGKYHPRKIISLGQPLSK